MPPIFYINRCRIGETIVANPKTTLTDNKNFLQPTGFKISIDRTKYGNLEYFCNNVVHPGATVGSVEIPIPRLSGLPIAGDKIQFPELSVDVLLDEDMKSYQEMQDWMERLVEKDDFDMVSSQARESNHTSDITLTILSSHNNKNVQIRYADCFPTQLGSITLQSNTSAVEYPTFNISFRFTSYEFIT